MNTGGPAFPKLTQDERWKTFTSTDGMTLRDYFATHATRDDIKPYMEGPRTTQLVKDMNGYTYEVNAPIKRTIEQAKYLYADEMLKAREL